MPLINSYTENVFKLSGTPALAAVFAFPPDGDEWYAVEAMGIVLWNDSTVSIQKSAGTMNIVNGRLANNITLTPLHYISADRVLTLSINNTTGYLGLCELVSVNDTHPTANVIRFTLEFRFIHLNRSNTERHVAVII